MNNREKWRSWAKISNDKKSWEDALNIMAECRPSMSPSRWCREDSQEWKEGSEYLTVNFEEQMRG